MRCPRSGIACALRRKDRHAAQRARTARHRHGPRRSRAGPLLVSRLSVARLHAIGYHPDTKTDKNTARELSLGPACPEVGTRGCCTTARFPSWWAFSPPVAAEKLVLAQRLDQFSVPHPEATLQSDFARSLAEIRDGPFLIGRRTAALITHGRPRRVRGRVRDPSRLLFTCAIRAHAW